MKLEILSKIQKHKVALAFEKHQSTGHQKFVDKDTLQDKPRLMPLDFSSQNAILPSES